MALKARPRQAIAAEELILDQRTGALKRRFDLESLTSRPVRMMRARSGAEFDDEPGVDGDAMAADAGAGPQDVDAGMPVGEVDHLPDIDVERSQISESSLAKAMLTSRNAFSVSLTISAAEAEVVTQAPRTNSL